MRNGGLLEKFENAGGAVCDPAAFTPAHRLDHVAHALRTAVDRTARSIAAAPPPMAPLTTAPDVAARHEVELPQILQHPPRGLGEAGAATRERRRGQLVAPALLAAALIGVALLMSVQIVDMSRLPGWGMGDSPPRPRLSSLTPQRMQLSNSLDAGAASLMEVVPALTAEELTLLERCEAMIVRGDMAGARKELASAANEGSANARFALAETFDPNVLAAWGLRDRIADVGAARALYEQALATGDTRAQARLVALRAE